MTEDILELRRPAAELAPFVFGFVRRRDNRGGAVVRLLPEARASIQIFRADPYWVREDEGPWREVPRAAIWGPRLTPGFGYARSALDVYAAGLTPAGVRALCGRPQADYFEAHAPPPEGAVANAAVCAFDPALGFDDWIAIISDAWRACVATAPAPPPIATAAEAFPVDEPIAEVAARFGYSERHFRRAFAAEFGAAPKAWQRVRRFDEILKRLHPRPWERPSGDDAADAFADQAHLIREFCAFAGVTPAAYARDKRQSGDRILRSIVVDGVAPPLAG
ncbi:MAG: AraC family transcriptional regulator [Parvularculaceae bacterium]|nr:AraC family transcriptional regulator [Parvularculaceae bacterium]